MVHWLHCPSIGRLPGRFVSVGLFFVTVISSRDLPSFSFCHFWFPIFFNFFLLKGILDTIVVHLVFVCVHSSLLWRTKAKRWVHSSYLLVFCFVLPVLPTGKRKLASRILSYGDCNDEGPWSPFCIYDPIWIYSSVTQNQNILNIQFFCLANPLISLLFWVLMAVLKEISTGFCWKLSDNW